MKSRFLPALILLFFAFSGISRLSAQNQDSLFILIDYNPGCNCSGVAFINVIGGIPPYQVLWSNGAFQNTDGQSVLDGLCPGTYCLTVTDESLASTSTCFTMPTISGPPIYLSSSNTAPCNFDSLNTQGICEKVCPGATVTYTATISQPGSPSSPVNWNVTGAGTWTVNAGNSPFSSSITVTWDNPGYGNVSVNTDGVQGCPSSANICVVVVEEPQAAFTPAPAGGVLQVCLGETVNFVNQSTGNAEFFEWYFSDDLSSSNEENPQHTYSNPGTYTVTLIARSGCLCADTTTLQVEVLNAQAPGLSCVGTICPGESVTYTATGVCQPYTWSVSSNGSILNGGTAASDSITIEWGDGPVGSITLNGQPCSGAACPVAGVIEIPIISDNAEIEGLERVCPGAREVYSIEAFGGTGFVWTLSGGGTILEGQGTHQVVVEWGTTSIPGVSYTLTVKYDNCYLGCGGQDDIQVRVVNPLAINGPLELCANASGIFISRQQVSNVLVPSNWTLYGPNGSVVWTSGAPVSAPNVPFPAAAGTYRLVAVPNDPNQSCSDEAEWSIAVRALPDQPTGIDGETNICPGTTYAYEATGLPPGANIQWTLKNGTGATQTLNGNPLNVTWGNTGPYWLLAAQISADGLGCLSDTVGLTANPISIPAITGTTVVCEDTKGTYTVLPYKNVQIQWSLSPATAGAVADGQGSSSVEIFWSQPGGHAVNVSVCGQTDLFPVTVLANPDPVVLHPQGLCPGATATVQTASTYSSYTWTDAQGSVVSTSATPTLQAGVYSLSVTDANGCSGVSEFTIQLWDEPNVSLTTADPTGFCNNSLTVSLTALTNTDGDYTYTWFQNGVIIPGATGTVYFTNQYGDYTVVATNSYGCTNSAGPIRVFEYCVAGGSGCCNICNGNQLCPPGSIQAVPDPTPRCDSFHMVLNDYSGLYVAGSAVWKTGISGGALIGTATGDDATFIYPNAGKYIVTMQVTLSTGLICETLDSLDVEAVAGFQYTTDCAGDPSLFENTSEFLPESGISQYAWNFGDAASGANNTSAAENPAHSFDPAGPYTVQLTVTALSGCTSSASAQLDIPSNDPPVFVNPANTCAGNALEFTLTPPPGATEIVWDFGDPASAAANDATGNTVYHNFSPGVYTVTASATNTYGCKASYSSSITIAPNPLSGNISPANPAPICEGKTITLTAPAGGVSYVWSDPGSTLPTLTVAEEGVYQVTITDANGCTYVPPAAKVDVNPAPDALIKGLLFNEVGNIVGTAYPSVTLCFGEDIALQATTNGAANFSWSGGNGTNALVYFTEDRNTLLPVGTHTYTVTVTSTATGCTAVSDPMSVLVNPLPSGFWIGTNTICAGNPNTITYNGPTPANWQFFWNTGLSGTTLTTEDAGTYYIRVINEFGCEEKSNPVTILPGPPVSSVPSGCHTRCSPDTLCLPSLYNVASIQWYFEGSPLPGATSPNLIANQSGTYWAELTDWYGCTGTSDPLTLNLLTGYGNIHGKVWSDVNNNGVIDPMDTLMSGITVVVFQNGTPFGAPVSDVNGAFALSNVLSTNYTFNVDPLSLPFGWTPVIGQDQLMLSGCDVEGDVEFLLKFGCTVFATLELKACPGDVLNYNGTNIPVGGSHIFHFSSFQSCDSTLVVNVTALPVSTGSVELKTCPGTTADYNGTPLAIGQTQVFHYTNAVGCDSAVTVTVAALPVSTNNIALQTCPGTTADYNGTPLAIGQTQVFHLTNAVGCDSAVTVTVSALPVSTNNVALKACPGTTADYNGTPVAIGQTQVFHLTNAVGCDSAVTVTVSALPVSSSALTVGVCPNETYTYQGITLQAGDVRQFNLSNFVGCDSVVTVTVYQKNSSVHTEEVYVCPGESYTFMGQTLSAGDTRIFHLVNAEACDSALTLVVKAYPETLFNADADPSCSSTATGSIEVTGVNGGPGPYRYSLDGTGYQDAALFSDLDAGTYTVYVEDGNACVSTLELSINQIPKLDFQLANGILPCDSAKVLLTPVILSGDTSIFDYTWWDGTRDPFKLAIDAGSVWLEITDNCETVRREASVQWAELGEDLDIVYVPNVFKPSDNDAVNAEFKPLFAAGLNLLRFHFEVFDRWGDKLFETESLNEAWNGVFRDKSFNPGVQVWQLEAEVAICGRILQVRRKGDVTVVR